MKSSKLFTPTIWLLCLGFLTSCAGKSPDNTKNPDINNNDTETTVDDQPEYVYPDVNLNGEAFSILSSGSIWNMNVTLDVEEMTGETLSDTMYQRNRRAEERFKCKIEVDEVPSLGTMDDLVKKAYASIMSGEDEYDIIYLPVNKQPSMITEGCFADLYSIPELALDKPWWDQTINDSCKLGGKLYFAAGSFNLMAFDGSWCIFFNENMLEDYDLDKPYDLVREGKWTIDKLNEYCTKIATLGAQDSFAWKKNGDSIYGISAHPNAPDKFIFSTGRKYVDVGNSDYPVFSADNEGFYNVASKLAGFFSNEGAYFNAHYDDMNADQGGYLYAFTNRRSVFMTAELKTSQLLRDMDDTFGIVPFPKYDESQESYHTAIVENLLVMTIPITNNDRAATAAVIDALTYDSYKNVIPVYYNITVSQKGLRNDDSIEMLETIRTTRGVDMAYFFGWNADLASAVRSKLLDGYDTIASDIASQKSAINTSIDNMVKQLEKLD